MKAFQESLLVRMEEDVRMEIASLWEVSFFFSLLEEFAD